MGAEAALTRLTRPAFGMVGVTSTETARLSAVLVDNPDLRPAPGQVDNPDLRVCVAEMKIVDGLGRTLAITQKVLPRPGMAQHLDLPGTRAYSGQPWLGLRAPIRGQVTALDGACTLALTMELFDSATG